jgi:membrane protein DedA with SNARE-associated domain/rhodanese-related sulfurtransferase
MMDSLLSLYSDHGLSAIFLVTLAARIGAPFPAAPLLVVAGALGRSAQPSIGVVAVASILANLAGDAVWFGAGRVGGTRVLRILCRVSMSPDVCVRQSEDLIARWGGASLVAAKFVPGVSVVAAPMAGALGMRWPPFIAYAILAGAIWTLLFLGIGAMFEGSMERVLDMLANGGLYGGALLACLLTAFVAYRWQRRRSFRQSVDVPRISVLELRERIDSGRAPMIVDVRPPSGVRMDPRQIPGSVNVGLADIKAFALELTHDQEVVLYCNCPNEASAAHAAVLLTRTGVLCARPLAGGMEAWFAGHSSI